MIHALKTEPQFFEAVINKQKNFEVRKNDRDFRVGDYLALNELDDKREGYTGRSVLLRVKYILDDERFCKEGFVVLGFHPIAVSDVEEMTILYGGCREWIFSLTS